MATTRAKVLSTYVMIIKLFLPNILNAREGLPTAINNKLAGLQAELPVARRKRPSPAGPANAAVGRKNCGPQSRAASKEKSSIRGACSSDLWRLHTEGLALACLNAKIPNNIQHNSMRSVCSGIPPSELLDSFGGGDAFDVGNPYKAL